MKSLVLNTPLQAKKDRITYFEDKVKKMDLTVENSTTKDRAAADMIEGIDIQVDQGEFKIWRAYTNMDRIYAAE